MKAKLPTTVAILAALAAATSFSTGCTRLSMQQNEGEWKTMEVFNRSKKSLKAARQAAKACASMEWHAVVTSYPRLRKTKHWGWDPGAPKNEEFTLPVSAADAGTIRGLILHKMQAVPVGPPPVVVIAPGEVSYRIELRFLDAAGKGLHTFDACNVSDISFDTIPLAYGELESYITEFVLPTDAYATWEKLIPSAIHATIDKRKAEWKRRFNR